MMLDTVALWFVGTLVVSTCSGSFEVHVNTDLGAGPLQFGDGEGLQPLKYLERAGYLDDLDGLDHQNHAPDSVKRALSEFQQYAGLPVTGRLDQPTVNMMRKPRCGVPDVIKPSERSKMGAGDIRPENLSDGSKWQKNDVTYKWVRYTNQLSQEEQRRAVKSALQKWSDVTPLNFVETTGEADMDFQFAAGEHGCGTGFDGPGSVLAHAFFPGDQRKDGDVHFDNDETWTATPNAKSGISLFAVAIHELGHALGLHHSDVLDSIMFAMYQGEVTGLKQDDIRRIQEKYGPRRGGGRPPRPTRRPRPTMRPDNGDCNLRFNAIAQLKDGRVLAFAGPYVYNVTSKGLKQGMISDEYPGAPVSPGAVAYDPYAEQLLFFEGDYYWRFSGRNLDAGYPKYVGKDFADADAVIMRHDRQFYIIKNGNVTRWEEGMTQYPYRYPQDINYFFDRSSPAMVEAAFEADNRYTYLFQGDKYWRYQTLRDGSERLSPGYPKRIGPFWLHCGYVSDGDKEPLNI